MFSDFVCNLVGYCLVFEPRAIVVQSLVVLGCQWRDNDRLISIFSVMRL